MNCHVVLSFACRSRVRADQDNESTDRSTTRRYLYARGYGHANAFRFLKKFRNQEERPLADKSRGQGEAPTKFIANRISGSQVETDLVPTFARTLRETNLQKPPCERKEPGNTWHRRKYIPFVTLVVLQTSRKATYSERGCFIGRHGTTEVYRGISRGRRRQVAVQCCGRRACPCRQVSTTTLSFAM